jgi:DNA-binding transcriptional MocR family regulator
MGEYLRLGFCFYDPEALEKGIVRLRESLEN